MDMGVRSIHSILTRPSKPTRHLCAATCISHRIFMSVAALKPAGYRGFHLEAFTEGQSRSTRYFFFFGARTMII
jgi:hypothetical protein